MANLPNFSGSRDGHTYLPHVLIRRKISALLQPRLVLTPSIQTIGLTQPQHIQRACNNKFTLSGFDLWV